jgi:hypothetical protein
LGEKMLGQKWGGHKGQNKRKGQPAGQRGNLHFLGRTVKLKISFSLGFGANGKAIGTANEASFSVFP